MKRPPDIHHFSSISQLMRFCGLPAPLSPLVALVDYGKHAPTTLAHEVKISLDFYKISFKNSFSGQVRYGQGVYDFEEGGLAFLKPGQLVVAPGEPGSYEGYVLYVHPDLIRSYPLGNAIHQYGFFSYATSEALLLSAKEKAVMSNLFDAIAAELENNIDAFSQDILVAQLELLLSHSNRFYNRQFITRKTLHHDMITRLDKLLNEYVSNNQGLTDGIPSVSYICAQLNVSQRYLSDMLRVLTGQNTQQYIQHHLIEQSKDLLSSTSLSVSEIAYQLGFEHPQSFSKLFKGKTNLSPLQFRRSFD